VREPRARLGDAEGAVPPLDRATAEGIPDVELDRPASPSNRGAHTLTAAACVIGARDAPPDLGPKLVGVVDRVESGDTVGAE
jgi:ABC-type sugar transport system substrate-binding protein